MSQDNPYPAAEATITYSLREVIDQINHKLDLIPQIVSDQATMKNETREVKARVLVLEGKVETIEKIEDQAVGGNLFRDRFWARLVALAGVMGVVAGLTVQIIASL